MVQMERLAGRPNRTRNRGIRALPAAVSVLAVSCTGAGPGEAVRPLVPFAESQAPLSQSHEIALADDTTACVISSYHIRIYCTSPGDSPTGVFGRKGEGPGEFIEPSYLTRGPDGTIGVVDLDLNRMTIWKPKGERVSEVTVPSIFRPTAPFGSSLSGYIDISNFEPNYRHVEIDVSSGEIIWLGY